ncbi:MAG: hypothetical protein IPG69_18335 [Flavobacteriales bacterium]|nr:hypothetical protein [Flavobacteriales bacterium]MBK9077385.1 hypothetical protein [Flavobacteriales bacterium]MBK9538801.1 hypothetical protein [Flavobacteriales bacterium]
MSVKAIKAKAEELLSFGIPKQQAFDNLMLQFPEAKPKKVAEVLRYMPSLLARERYRSLHLALLGLIAASAALRLARPLLTGSVGLDQATAYLSLVPIATLLLGYSLYRWQGQVFEWVGWGNVVGVFGLMKELNLLAKDGVDLWDLSGRLLSVCIGGVALYLAYRVFTKPKVEKDPLGGPDRVVFREEHPI